MERADAFNWIRFKLTCVDLGDLGWLNHRRTEQRGRKAEQTSLLLINHMEVGSKIHTRALCYVMRQPILFVNTRTYRSINAVLYRLRTSRPFRLCPLYGRQCAFDAL
jgi:hypothetical protein